MRSLLIPTLLILGARGLCGQQTPSRDTLDWQQRYEVAKSKRNSGLLLTVPGLGIAALGAYFSATAGESLRITNPFGYSYILQQTNTGRRAAGIAAAASGTALTIFGLRRYGQGRREVRQLQQKRKPTARLSIRPAPIGLGLSLGYTF